MGLPEPIFPLSGHCSIINDGTLYVYSPAGFQSLDLAEGAKWKALPMDISLTGAQCVKAGSEDSAMLYVVGGAVNETAADWSYPGLMGYSIAQKKWDWIRPETWVTQNRQNHAAIYLEDAQTILVYAGSQTTGDVIPSTQTFQISTVVPYRVNSAADVQAPPSVRPMLMPWDSNHAVMIGGGATNTAVWTFGAAEGWRNLGVALEEPITNQDAVQCTVVSGDDGSKVLERFDMSVSPNKVSRTVLLKQGGTVASPGQTVGDKTKRLTIQDWPSYNGTYAPEAVRSGYSVAHSENGTVVVTGGSDVDPLCIFDLKENAWINATELFEGKQQQSILLSTSSSSSTIPTSTASPSPSASAEAVTPAAAPVNNKDKMLTVLGATLGAIFGIAAILILILFCLKHRKSKKQQAQQSGYIEKDRLSFADRGTEYMTEAGGSVGHKFAEANSSQTSLAILSGRATGHRKGLASDGSTTGLVKKTSPLGYSEPVELSKFDLKPEPVPATMVRQNSSRAPPQPRAAVGNVSRSRSSGWSRYFANNEATNLAMPADRSTYASERTSTGSQSMYTNSRMYSQPSQAIPPLEIPKLDGQRINKVAKGSPTLGNSTENLPGQSMLPMQAELARANSNGSTHSGISHHDHYMRSPVESWTPVGDNDRPTSSNYTGSVVIDNTSTYYPDNTSSFYPKSNFSSFYPGQTPLGAPDGRDSTVTMFPNPNGPPKIPDPFGSQYPAPPRVPAAPEGREKDRESTVTMFPRPGGEGPSKKEQQDMSWLNLGAGK
ncbi:hypothetical protein K458DRAFT_297966 [Lentithecium fluviatile CBS 122367]|uniref:Galactose oxidase n=1 Tax=Lentithecium fluviatile CBS 122367 TaxID=1168545 RepID=A0A6G1J8Q0_9PLEO|nr:hypothetical protein K458DRAFT_297966 [Lentithecium fluviatile CBS 122367]